MTRLADYRLIGIGGIVYLTEASLLRFGEELLLSWRYDEDFASWAFEGVSHCEILLTARRLHWARRVPDSKPGQRPENRLNDLRKQPLRPVGQAVVSVGFTGSCGGDDVGGWLPGPACP
jgi:hypothetical protein